MTAVRANGSRILYAFFVSVSVIFFSSLSLAGNHEFIPGHVLVKIKASSANHTQSFHAAMASQGAKLSRSFDQINLHHYIYPPETDIKAVIATLKQNPDVEFAEPNWVLRVATAKPGAENVMSAAEAIQQAQSSQGQYMQSGAPTQISQAWAAMTPSSMITPIVAVIDTGIDYNHLVFKQTGAVYTNPGETGVDREGRNKASNGLDDDGNGFVDDWRGWNFAYGTNDPYDDADHGTHVSGIILGVTENILAMNPTPAVIRIMPLKFLDSTGSGSTSDAISAIYYAANNGANVINNSWGGADYSQSLHDALTFAYNHRVFVAVAAGNNASNNDTNQEYPASYPVPSLMAVAASDDWDYLASFSDYGKNSVPLSAPGVAVYSTLPNQMWGMMSGTSMATPFVAGVAALAFREAPNLTGYQIKNVIASTVDQVSGLSPYVFTSGRADVLNAVNIAKGEVAVQAIQPSYQAVPPPGYRAPASSSGGMGCGTVGGISALMHKGGRNGPGFGGGFALALTFAIPMMVWVVLRRRAMNMAQSQMANRRQYERFAMNSAIRVNVGDRELVGKMQTISEGGISFCADSMLEKGGIITMHISSPDGKESFQIQGQIVWNEENKAYGVKFSEQRQSIASMIRSWSAGLSKAS